MGATLAGRAGDWLSFPEALMKTLAMIVCVILLTACTKKGTYEAVQVGQRNECQPLFGYEYDKCMEQYSMPYDEYERERKKALE